MPEQPQGSQQPDQSTTSTTADAKPTIKSVTADPEFYQFTLKTQKQILSQVDPEVGKFSDDAVNEILERANPAAYAQTKRGVKLPDMKTESPITTAAAADVVNAGRGIGKFIETQGDILSLGSMGRGGIETAKKGIETDKQILKGMYTPFEQLTAKSELGKQLTAEHNPHSVKKAWMGLNFVSAFMGGDPDQAWKDYQAHEYGSGTAHLLAVPLATFGTGKLLGKLGSETSAAARGGEALEQQENMAALFGNAPVKVGAGGEEIVDNETIAREVTPLIKQHLEEEGFHDISRAKDLYNVIMGDIDEKGVGKAYSGQMPSRRSFMGHKLTRETPAFDVQGNPTEAFTSNVRAGARKILQSFDGAVDIADRPFKTIIGKYGAESAEGVPDNISRKMEAIAKDEMGSNEPLAKAINNLAKKVKAAKTIDDLNDIKITANKKIKDALNSAPGKAADDTASSLHAWKIAADGIREELYPLLQQKSSIDLKPFGRREAIAIAARDGVYRTYYTQVDPTQASAAANGYLGQIEEGSLWKTHVLKRALRIEPEPAGRFNLYFRRGVGELGKGAKPENLSIVEWKALPAGGDSKPMFRMQGTLPEEFITPIKTSTSKVYAGTRDVPNPDYEPFEASSHQGRSYQEGNPEYRKDPYKPPRQRLKELGPKESVTPERSITGNPTKKETVWQLMPEHEGGEVLRGGGGVMYTSDPQAAYQTLSRLKDYAAGAPMGRNITPFAALPRELQESIQNSIVDLDRQLMQYSTAKAKMGNSRAQFTPYKPGTVTHPHRVTRYGGTTALSQAGQQSQTQP